MSAVDDFLAEPGAHVPPADTNGWDRGALKAPARKRSTYRRNPTRRPEPADSTWDYDPPDDLDRYYGGDV